MATTRESSLSALYVELNRFGQNGEYERALKTANKSKVNTTLLYGILVQLTFLKWSVDCVPYVQIVLCMLIWLRVKWILHWEMITISTFFFFCSSSAIPWWGKSIPLQNCLLHTAVKVPWWAEGYFKST